MSWLGFTSPLAAWLFLLTIPLVIFYFLKLRRPRVEIPSLALWRRVLNDQRVNSPFQKFKRNLLLLFQLLLLFCLILAAMQPFRPAGAERARFIPVLIDCSASMAARTSAGGATRLDEAKDQVRRLIDNLVADQRLCLIAVHSSGRRLTEFTNNKRLLHAALDDLEVQQVPSRLEDGLRIAEALARANPVEEAILITDGNVPDRIDFELPFKINYQKLDQGGTNIGITDFNARRNDTGWDVFARLEGAKDAKSLVEVELLQDGKSVSRQTASIEGGNAERLVFQIPADAATQLELKIRPDGFDALDSDNVAWLSLPLPRSLIVYCPASLASVRHALEVLPDLELYPRDGKEPAEVDLKFNDQPLETGPESRVTVHFGVIPAELQSLVKMETGLADVIDWVRTSPMLRHVQLFDVQIADKPANQNGATDREFELAGYEVIVQSRTGPLVLEKRGEGGLDEYFLFHPDRSTLPYRVGFPILISNLRELAQQKSGLTDARSAPTGALPPLALAPDTAYRIVGPNGRTDTGRSDGSGLLSGAGAPVIGEYQIQAGGVTKATVGVSLLSPAETSLAAIPRLQFPEVAVAAASSGVKNDQPLWPWFAAAALAFLLIEWWYFQRPPQGIPA